MQLQIYSVSSSPAATEVIVKLYHILLYSPIHLILNYLCKEDQFWISVELFVSLY